MTHSRDTKLKALFLCAAFCFVMAFSAFFIADEADHDCTGKDCPICAEIAVCVALLQTAATAAAVAVIRPLHRFIIEQPLGTYDIERYANTLVSLKVLLLD